MMKQATTHEEQIKILKNRGLIIEDDKSAINILKNINYYRFSGYVFNFYKANSKDIFEGVSFDDIYSAYKLDEVMRLILFKFTTRIEIRVKAVLAYKFAHTYGPDGYMQFSDAFKKQESHSFFIEKLCGELNKNESAYILHHKNKYQSKYPIWVIVETLTFGELHMFIKNLCETMLKQIAQEFNLLPQNFENWLSCAVLIRNSSAHNARFYKAKLNRTPRNYYDRIRFERSPLLFRQIRAINLLLLNEDSVSFILEMEKLENTYKSIKFKTAYGFPNNWQNVLRNDRKALNLN